MNINQKKLYLEKTKIISLLYSNDINYKDTRINYDLLNKVIIENKFNITNDIKKNIYYLLNKDIDNDLLNDIKRSTNISNDNNIYNYLFNEYVIRKDIQVNKKNELEIHTNYYNYGRFLIKYLLSCDSDNLEIMNDYKLYINNIKNVSIFYTINKVLNENSLFIDYEMKLQIYRLIYYFKNMNLEKLNNYQLDNDVDFNLDKLLNKIYKKLK